MLVLKETADKAFSNFIIFNNQKASPSDWLGKKLEEFLKWFFDFLISQFWHPEGFNSPWHWSLWPASLPDPHCYFCLVLQAFPHHSILAIVRGGSGTISSNFPNAWEWELSEPADVNGEIAWVLNVFLGLFHRLWFLPSRYHSPSQNFTATVLMTFLTSICFGHIFFFRVGGCVDSEAKILLYFPGLLCVRNFNTHTLCGHWYMLTVLEVRNLIFCFPLLKLVVCWQKSHHLLTLSEFSITHKTAEN